MARTQSKPHKNTSHITLKSLERRDRVKERKERVVRTERERQRKRERQRERVIAAKSNYKHRLVQLARK